jgi:hypothetical protein
MVFIKPGSLEPEIHENIRTTVNMKKYLVITIDVEPDCTPTWHYADPVSYRGVSVGIAEKLQPLFKVHDVAPTYLINNVVLEDENCLQIFRQLTGHHELGTHLHPEFINPDKRFSAYGGKKAEGNSCFYPPEIEFEKIKSITELFTRGFGRRPTSFRAGRYSAGLNTMMSLRKLGYLVDTSVTPHMLWNDPSREKAVDFRNAPEQPYFMSPENITVADNEADLLQVPVSIISKKRNVLKELLISGAGRIHPRRKNKTIWLRPFYSSTKEMIGIANQFTKTYRNQPALVLNMMFHNVEVIPGLSPYCQTEKECRLYLKQLEDFFSFCNGEGTQSVTLTELYDELRKK